MFYLPFPISFHLRHAQEAEASMGGVRGLPCSLVVYRSTDGKYNEEIGVGTGEEGRWVVHLTAPSLPEESYSVQSAHSVTR